MGEEQSKVKFLGIIGCGARVSGLATNLTQVFGQEKIKVKAICDSSEKSRELASKKFGKDVEFYDDYKELVKDPSLNWIMIGSWNCFHKNHIVASLEAGKNVFTEKPMAISVKEVQEIKTVWKKSGKKLVIGFTLRYSPHYRKIKSLIDSGRIGEIISLEFNETLEADHGGFIHGDWRRRREWAGSHLMEKCCHDLDIVNWLVGSLPNKVASFGGCNFFIPENEKHMERLADGNSCASRPYMRWEEMGQNKTYKWPIPIKLENPFTAKDKNIVDNQVAIIEYQNQVRATFHTNCNAAITERRMYILGTKGTIRSDVLTGSIELKRIGYGTLIHDESTGGKGMHGGGDPFLLESLSECILKDKEPLSSVDEGLKATVTACAIDDAMDSGQVVYMDKYWDSCDVKEIE